MLRLDYVFQRFILPLFNYGDAILGRQGNTTLMAELQALYNKAARLILDLILVLNSLEVSLVCKPLSQ